MREDPTRGGLTVGTPDRVVRGRVFASLRPGEITLQIVWWKPGGEAGGAIFPVATAIVAPDARMPNTAVWIDVSGEHGTPVRVWRRGDEE